MADNKTITALKTNFLRQQIRILSQPLKLSDRAKERAELSDGDLRDIMLRANQILRRHNNSVYDRVAVSNVATQIEQLFWFASEPEDLLAGDGGGEGSDGVLRVGDDLVESENIHKLASAVDEEEQTDEFTDALTRLQELDQRRQVLKRKLEQYKTLKEIIEPLKNPQQNVQPDLVTRDGPLSEELAKTKALGIRVAAGVARRNERGAVAGAEDEDEEEDGDVVMVDEGAKVAAVLGKR